MNDDLKFACRPFLLTRLNQCERQLVVSLPLFRVQSKSGFEGRNSTSVLFPLRQARAKGVESLKRRISGSVFQETGKPRRAFNRCLAGFGERKMRGRLLRGALANLWAPPGNRPLNDTQGCEGASQNNSRPTVLGSRPFHLS
jgi:hypothetical protein